MHLAYDRHVCPLTFGLGEKDQRGSEMINSVCRRRRLTDWLALE